MSSKLYDQYDIPDHDRETMMVMLGIDHNDPEAVLPDKTRHAYIDMRIAADRVGMSMDTRFLLMACYASGSLGVVPKAPDDICTMFHNREVKQGDLVLCTLGRKKNLEGSLLTVRGDDEIVVVMKEDGEERSFKPDKVRLASAS